MKRTALAICLALAVVSALAPQGSAGAPATSHEARPFSEGVQDYPRLASLYALTQPNQASALARYALVIGSPGASASGAVQAVKRANQRAVLIFYDNTSAVTVPGNEGMDIYPGWWLTLAGTRLIAPIDAISSTIPVTNAAVIGRFLTTNPDVLVDGETMHVLAVDAAHNQLTVQRGYFSQAAPHGAGSRVAAHATKWPHTWLLNVTPYCPPNPHTGLTWIQYAAAHAKQEFGLAPWDGILWDDGNVSFAPLSGGQLDANNDNVADGGDGPSGTGWHDGVTRLLALTRSLVPGKLQLVTDAYYPGLMNGEEMEHFPFYSGGWVAGFNSYRTMTGPGGTAPFSVISADTANGTDTVNSADDINSTAKGLRRMRYALAASLMGDGFFSFDYGPYNHGQTWWFDEYDEGAGSSLVRAVNASQTTIQVAGGTGDRFRIGDVVHVPDGNTGHNDEQMLIVEIAADTLSVQRGVNGSTAAVHPILSKVVTQEQLMAGLGWLGQPRAPAAPLKLHGPSLLANPNFDASTPEWFAPWSLNVVSPSAATIRLDTHTAPSSRASARIDIGKAAPGNSWYVALIQQNTPGRATLHLVAGKPYTLSFWARSNADRTIDALVQQSRPPWLGRAGQQFALTRQWQQFSLTFTAPTTESAVKVQFSLAQMIGTVWLDGIRLQQGDPNLWRRDFARGTALLNYTNSPQTVALGSGYRHIMGTQDPLTNDGKAVTVVTVPPQDGLLLEKTQ